MPFKYSGTVKQQPHVTKDKMKYPEEYKPLVATCPLCGRDYSKYGDLGHMQAFHEGNAYKKMPEHHEVSIKGYQHKKKFGYDPKCGCTECFLNANKPTKEIHQGTN
jgi:hypothetical protein